MKLGLKFGKPKRLMGLKVHHDSSEQTNFSKMVQCGSLHEIEANVNLVVYLKENSLELCSQIVMETSL
jgi:hypothetical protein